MVRALRPFKSELDLQKVDNGEVDEYFVVALDKAALASEGGADPIVLTRPPASVSAWDFQVDTFESAEEQGVVPQNILAAGALDYIYVLGERLGVYKLADALVLRWAAGTIDIEGDELSNRLYRYWKLREDRMTAEERGMVYKRVLDKGDTEVLSRMVVNEAFQSLWHALMETTTQYIEREQAASATTLLSRRPITLATQQLQYNLTEYATGMVHLQAAEMYAQLKDAFDLLGSDEIVAQLTGGRRRNMWAAIGQLAHDEFGVVPDIGSLRTLAVEGNKVFRWIADFQAGAFTEDEFESFKGSAEEWIIAAASQGPDLSGGEADEETEELDDEEEIAAIEREADF
jgi:hypothetical protein